MKVAVIDYGLGNIQSVTAALGALSINYVLDIDGGNLRDSDIALVPGVASFGAAMERIRTSGQEEPLRDHFSEGKPLVGLCLGAQLFMNRSEEDLSCEGFGFLDGEVVALDARRCRVPNQGWLRTRFLGRPGTGSFPGSSEAPHFYYSHSFQVRPRSQELVIAKAAHGDEEITAVYQYQNILGIQFHPERSGPMGLAYLGELIRSLESARD